MICRTPLFYPLLAVFGNKLYTQNNSFEHQVFQTVVFLHLKSSSFYISRFGQNSIVILTRLFTLQVAQQQNSGKRTRTRRKRRNISEQNPWPASCDITFKAFFSAPTPNFQRCLWSSDDIISQCWGYDCSSWPDPGGICIKLHQIALSLWRYVMHSCVSWEMQGSLLLVISL